MIDDREYEDRMWNRYNRRKQQQRQLQNERDRQEAIEHRAGEIFKEVASTHVNGDELRAQVNSRGDDEMTFLIQHGYARSGGRSACGIYRTCYLTNLGMKSLMIAVDEFQLSIKEKEC